ncbi:hypothetical protein LCGC14_1238580 [marine sediment metagenome]|uniref:Uncharacterized protein n=1 Tax=marine sediment metagenome TaxID=412755 RepID=A0A0F9NNR1_9ZZZZ
MKRYRTLLYHSKWGDGHVIDNVIALTTQAYNLWRFIDPVLWDVVKMGFSHEEIWVPDENDDFMWTAELMYPNGPYKMDGYAGICYTSTMGQVRGSNNVGDGTCKRNAALVLKHSKRWSYVEHSVPDWEFTYMVQYLEDQVTENKGYGLGPNKNICSEISHNANVVSGELAGPFKVVTPIGDALLLVKSGKKIIPLKGVRR